MSEIRIIAIRINLRKEVFMVIPIGFSTTITQNAPFYCIISNQLVVLQLILEFSEFILLIP
jgi:hypothetical protein